MKNILNYVSSANNIDWALYLCNPRMKYKELVKIEWIMTVIIMYAQYNAYRSVP